MIKIHKFIGTFFGSGYWPWGPGTAGAALGVLIWYILFCVYGTQSLFSPFIDQGILILLATIIGTWSTVHLQKVWGKDPSKIVIDEAIGVWITLWMVPCHWPYILSAFILFRFFDILKPLGIRKMENIGGAFGVILDDILAGVYARVVLALIIHFSLFS